MSTAFDEFASGRSIWGCQMVGLLGGTVYYSTVEIGVTLGQRIRSGGTSEAESKT